MRYYVSWKITGKTAWNWQRAVLSADAGLLVILRPREGAQYCDQRVCMSVCVGLSVCCHVSKTTCPNFWKFSVYVTCCHGSVSRWRQCNTSCTSGFVDDVMFSHNGPKTDTGLEPAHPFPQIDIIGATVIVWRVREKIIRSVLCNTVCNNCAQCNAHTHTHINRPHSSLDWVLSHWAHFTGGIEAYPWDYFFLQCSDTVGWVIWPVKTRPRYDL